MSGVVKRSLSFPPDVFAGLEREARESGTTVSSLVAEASAQLLRQREGLRAVEEWEAEHGRLTDRELADADAELDRAGTP
jgi:hypothetical protein